MSYYKIFYNPEFIYLTDDLNSIDATGAEIIRLNNFKNENNKIEELLKGENGKTLILFSEDLEELFENFKKDFQWIEAAGGIVSNQHGEILLIHRRGFWDLPKGKVDPRESTEQAAIREVQEETGLKKLEIKRKIKLYDNFQDGTLHIYPLKKKLALKLTHWFVMKTTDEGLKPQTEEDIDEAKWVKTEDLKNYFPKMYSNLIDILSFVLK
jgi:8-oxo-dGTP pyrophosphatase MutT (NUDIX family)